ncbi:TRAP transporter small permease [Paracoccus aestuarii]|uniref:TRAP transporter small permease protein n=2 Tax=Paracoccus aestuarii TaxID=453842 RepID=A0A418ZUK7_9RHOB|nr:TRAP transporter small permease [Paracoccus aestuarii]RJL03298.1 TRAP transporter small permease [Paracoccus aestuarii]WCQ98775.1 TRAP transporter small permease [Paracoccus aestuarii]
MEAARGPMSNSKADPPALRIANAVGLALDRIAVVIATSAVVVIFLALMAEVFVRYFTSSGLGWPNEVPNILFPWLIMGGIVVGANRGAHIAAEFIRGQLSRTQLRVLMVLIHLMVAGVFASLAWLSLGVIQITRAQVFPITGLGQAWAYTSMLFGFGGISVASLANAMRVFFAADPSTLDQTETEHMT